MTSPIRLYLARHGRTAWNHQRRFQGRTDVPLDEVGRSQALGLADLLRGRVSAVIGSDLRRASESAEIVAQALGVPLLGVDEDLRERGYGIFEGLTREDCIERYPAEWASREGNRNFMVPGAESPAIVVERMHRGLERAVGRVRGVHESALVIGHGSSIRMFLESLSGTAERPMENMQFRELVHDGQRFSLV